MTPNHLIITYRVTSRNINLENLTKKIAAKATLNRKNSNQTVKLPNIIVKPLKNKKLYFFTFKYRQIVYPEFDTLRLKKRRKSSSLDCLRRF
jgi:hypothetical protein